MANSRPCGGARCGATCRGCGDTDLAGVIPRSSIVAGGLGIGRGGEVKAWAEAAGRGTGKWRRRALGPIFSRSHASIFPTKSGAGCLRGVRRRRREEEGVSRPASAAPLHSRCGGWGPGARARGCAGRTWALRRAWRGRRSAPSRARTGGGRRRSPRGSSRGGVGPSPGAPSRGRCGR